MTPNEVLKASIPSEIFIGLLSPPKPMQRLPGEAFSWEILLKRLSPMDSILRLS